MMAIANRLLNRLRRVRKKWSSGNDRNFHDDLFARQGHNPFVFSYPGYVTIRRFADLAAPHVEAAGSALDLGCGPAEITCELARRFPGVAFHGVDHSRKGIERAEENARLLNLKNISFAVADVESYVADREYGIVLMFDSFHHLVDPRRLLERLQGTSRQFLLIEPRGDWKGSHVRELDFDWIMADLENIRLRIAASLPDPALPRRGLPPVHGAPDSAAQALENRYSLDELRHIFRGFGLRLRGTVSGLEVFPADPFLAAPSREFFGQMAYEIFRELDERLVAAQIDILAKHWLIYASRDLPEESVTIPRLSRPAFAAPTTQGPYDVQFLGYDGPRRVSSGCEFRAQIRFLNRSFRHLSSQSGEHPDFLSYRWLDRRGGTAVQDGLRTALVRVVAPGEEYRSEMRIIPPPKTGTYTLAIDLVQEGKAWYGDSGNPCLRVPLRVQKR